MNNFGKVAVLKEAWLLFKKHFNLILGLIGVYIAYYVAQFVFDFIFRNSFIGFVISILFFLFLLVLQIGTYNFILKIVDGKKAHISDLYTYSNMATKILRNIVAGIIYSFAVLIGFIFFIIPGIYVGIRLMFFTYYIIDKDAGIMDSLQKSWNLTKNGVINLFFFSFILLIINIIGSILIIGMAFTLPFTFLATALLFRKFQK